MFVALPWLGAWATVESLTVMTVGLAIGNPFQQELLNETVSNGEWRATLLSVGSMTHRLFAAGLLFLMGDWVEAGNFDWAIWTAGGVCFVLVLFSSLLLKKTAPVSPV